MIRIDCSNIVIFDRDKVADKATFENGNQYPVGIKYVLVNGRVVVADEKTTDVKPGRVLR